MEKEEFFKKLQQSANRIGIDLNKNQLEQLYIYMKELKQWNEKINLTAIIKDEEILEKHFLDSLTINKYIEKNSKMIDVGTGAGFPGLPLKIARQDVNITLLDALNKRIKFLEEVIEKNNLNGITTIHYRAEEAGQNQKYREQYNIATSRAVAHLNILIEYLLPFVEIGGKCICMKGSNIKEEIENSKKAIKILGGEIEKIDEFMLPNTDIKRNIIVIRKISKTPSKYPRKAGIPKKEPIT